MMKIQALNADTDSEEEEEDEVDAVSCEAQEVIAEKEYLRALKLKSLGETDLCLNLLEELLQTEVLNENHQDKRCTIMKYNCHKNIALILEERNEYQLALQHYITAILIDSTDVATMHRFGQLALKMDATDLAEYAFESCLKRNSEHWCAAEGLLEVMTKNCNFIGAYKWARQILARNPCHERATQVLNKIQDSFRRNLLFLDKCSGGVGGGCDGIGAGGETNSLFN